MSHTRMTFMILTALLGGCVAFLGCPETSEMVEDVMRPTSIDPGRTEPPEEPPISPPEEVPVDGPDEPTPLPPPDPDTEPGGDFNEPTPLPPETEPGSDFNEPTAPDDPEDTPADPNEAPEDAGAGAGGLGG